MDKIFLNGMEFYAYHGVYAEENKLGQTFFVDLIIEADLKEASCTDDVMKSIDYAAVYTLVERVVTNKQFQLIETVAQKVAEQILATFHKALRVTVKVKKPNPPIRGHYDYVAVEITRERQ